MDFFIHSFLFAQVKPVGKQFALRPQVSEGYLSPEKVTDGEDGDRSQIST